MTVNSSSKKSPPWKKPAPKGGPHTKLTEQSKAKAAARARDAGRTYPNLVDNMHAAAEQRTRDKSQPRAKSKPR